MRLIGVDTDKLAMGRPSKPRMAAAAAAMSARHSA
jgi:hypothetical protein